MDIELKDIEFYTDSKVVLGYIYHEVRRFYVYVNNRVLRIGRSSCPTQWHYVPNDHNPADHATRAVAASHLKDTTWLSGPAFLCNTDQTVPQVDTFNLVDADSDAEVCSIVLTFRTVASEV